MGWALGGALISGVICLGTMPIWESLFGLITPMKLMELCNPSSPLLKRLSLEAPGTYHHSVMVANLAEAAADAVGADPFIAWAGAYYHDVGKLMNPAYFSENQLGGVNPHDDVSYTHLDVYKRQPVASSMAWSTIMEVSTGVVQMCIRDSRSGGRKAHHR